MNQVGLKLKQLGWCAILAVVICFAPWISRAQTAPIAADGATSTSSAAATLISAEGTVEMFHLGTNGWSAAIAGSTMNVGDQLRTGPHSRATLRLSNLSVLRVGELMTYEIEPPRTGSGKPVLNLKSGSAYFFSRDKPQEVQIRTPTVTGAIRGTEFNVLVGLDGRTTVTMIDGKVELTNAFGATVLNSGEQGLAEAGRAPMKTAVLNAVNVIQWNLYYPGVLDVDELDLSPPEKQLLADSVAAYQSGDLLAALKKYPANHQPASPADHLYLGALLLSVGLVDQALPHLEAASDTNHLALANALREIIATVKFEPWMENSTPKLATEFLAESYYQQSRGNLAAALALARKAVDISPWFGFAWERVAELEFCFSHTKEALAALDKAMALSPRNAQALALKGFLLAAQNKSSQARDFFEKAIAVDGALGNAWLGRGLVRIHQGDPVGGMEDLEVAAALEPNRSLLRSYLGKAFANNSDDRRAEKELELARKLDLNDPTSWLYLALLEQQENKINQAIQDLQKSQTLNDNRSLFRSKLLLDQDKAVRSANLATMYRDAGMDDVSVREAAKAVSYDYNNASAHLFLSDSFNELRDPTRFNLRYETAWFNELLLANLLAPVGAGRLSQTVSAQEYSKLFEADGLGFASQNSWRSDDQYHQLAAQYGTYHNTSWALDLDYQHNAGVRPNNALDRNEWYSTIKQQLTPSDSILLLAKYEDYSSGDNFQYYNPSASYRPNYKFDEQQQPILIGGFQHEWSPDIRTLLLGGRLVTRQQFSDLQAPQLLLTEDATGAVVGTDTQPFDVWLADNMEIYTAELQQIVQKEKFSVIAGARWQGGQIDFSDSLANPPLPPFLLPPASGSFSEPFQRVGGYGYLTVEPVDKLWLTGGAAYDAVKYPANFRSLPESAGTDERHLLEPKGAFVWSPFEQAALRGIYARSLGGVSLDESYRLEPTQLGGFVQTFRSVIPESVVGSLPAEKVELEGLALDLKFSHGTFAGLQVEHLDSNVRQTVGDFLLENGLAPFVPSTTRENLDYDEQSLSVSINQLLPDGFVVGANYRLTYSQLKTTFPQVPASVLPPQDQSALLHQIGGYLLYNHPSGLFARFDARGYVQANHGYGGTEPGDDFVQLDLQGGWRFFHRRAELLVGILNLTGQDYRLNPLNVYSELPRERVFSARFSFEF